jgi:4a-hydroxytetrahydrobiopterin dehydratase
MTSVTLYTRENCHLCDDAKAAIKASGVDVDLREVDVDTDRDLVRRYGTEVPVIVVDGFEAFRHRVTAKEFADYVRSPASRLGAGWRVVNAHHIEKEYTFPDFAKALAFTNEVGAIAEEEGHHPDIYLAWGKVRITSWTHDIDGLSRKDLALAAKIDARHQR